MNLSTNGSRKTFDAVGEIHRRSASLPKGKYKIKLIQKLENRSIKSLKPISRWENRRLMDNLSGSSDRKYL